jgi:NADPH-dependent 2,4-dienoyl-CoA reductase/sulfur reductase-like enzyme
LGAYIRAVHEQHGVTFHLGRAAASIDKDAVTLSDGTRIDADLVVIGIGVRPATFLAEQSGLAVDHGVLVDEFLRTSDSSIYAAGDIARWPDPYSGTQIRVEHFVVAERQGQTAAHNMLGLNERFDAVPFFWTEQHDLGIAYVGHAEDWDEAIIDGDLEKRDCSITYRRNGRELALAVIHRDLAGLKAEVEFEWRIARESAHKPDVGHAAESEAV